jgi:hypothetical protein
MAWQTLSLHFKQTYDGGYRYLDKCGEFMVDATQKLNFVAGEPKPTGAKMEIPEKGISANCDANNLTIFQEVPDGDLSNFVSICSETSALALKHFEPLSILKNGFALKEYWAFSKSDEMFAAILNLGGNYQGEIAKVVGMVPEYKKLDFWFTSGSKEFHMVVQPTTFEKTLLSKHNVGAQANRLEKSRVDRRNQFAERINKSFVVSHALLLELDLMENNPPSDFSLEKHFAELKQKSDELKKLLIVK